MNTDEPGSISSMKNIVKKNKQILAETEDWSPELQMRIEQTYVLECMIEALDK